MVSSGIVERPSGTRETPARTTSSGGRPVIVVPSMLAEPASGRTSPARVRMSVDFPAPFAPMTAVTSPRGTERLTASRARTGP